MFFSQLTTVTLSKTLVIFDTYSIHFEVMWKLQQKSSDIEDSK